MNNNNRIPVIIGWMLALISPVEAANLYTVTHISGTDTLISGPPIYNRFIDINNQGQMIMDSRELVPHVPIYSFVSINGTWVDIKSVTGGAPQAFRSFEVIDINNKGEVLAYSPSTDGWHGYVATFNKSRNHSNSVTITQTNRDLGNGVHGYSINDKSQVVGSYSSPLASGPVLIEANNNFVDLSKLFIGTTGFPNSINNCGQITGDWIVTNGETHAFVTNNARKMFVRDLGTLGGGVSIGKSINDRGQVVGDSVINDATGYTHAFLSDQRFMKDLGTLGGNNSYANKINGDGQVVGTAEVSSGDKHAFVTIDGYMRDLNRLIDPNKLIDPTTIDPLTGSAQVLNLTLESATSINDKGEILAYGLSTAKAYNSYHTFLLTPVRKVDGAKTSECSK